jgi:RING finger protein 121
MVDEEAGVVYAQVEHGDHTHSRVLFHPGHETLHGYLVTGILLTLVGSQLGLWAWQKRSPHTFRVASLGGLLAVPPLFSAYAGFYRMLFVFVGFVALLGRLAFIASRRPLDRSTPRKVYKFFLAIYQLTYGMAWLGYILILIELVLGIDMIWPAAAMHVTSFALLLIFYGAYFGVLERDIAELCADRMASTMGLPVSKEMPQTSSISLSSGCSLCAEPFEGEGGAAPFRRQIGEPAAGSRVPESLLGVNSEKVFTLNCGHRFHESCIRGWTIVGKKDTCSSCAEKVRIAEVLDARQPWQKAPVLWNQVLNAVRFILFWNPVILVILNFLISRIDEWDASMLPEGLVTPGTPPTPVEV